MSIAIARSRYAELKYISDLMATGANIHRVHNILACLSSIIHDPEDYDESQFEKYASRLRSILWNGRNCR